MLAVQSADPELDAPAPRRSTDVVQRVIGRHPDRPAACPEQDMSRWEDDGGAVLPSAQLAV